MLKGFQQLMKNFLGLVYPDLCIACFENHPLKKQLFCLSCSQELVRTDHLDKLENDFTSHFVGRVDVIRGASLFVYRKGTSIQKLMYQFKYNNKPEIGFQLGLTYAPELMDQDFFKGIDMIIPVPLFWKKQQKRGYNQSEFFAKGISQATGLPIQNKILIKKEATASQTKMSRADRVDNVSSTFTVENPSKIQGKHILLVDDVLTTGATLESCARLLSPYDCRCSMLTIAMGRM